MPTSERTRRGSSRLRSTRITSLLGRPGLRAAYFVDTANHSLQNPRAGHSGRRPAPDNSHEMHMAQRSSWGMVAHLLPPWNGRRGLGPA